MKFKIFMGTTVILLLLLIAPISVAAATNTEIIAIMKEGLMANLNVVKEGLIANGKVVSQAYWASGITALC